MKINKIILILLFVSTVIVGILFIFFERDDYNTNNVNIINVNKDTESNNISDECINDNDCIVSGCSGQLCLNRNNTSNVISTCEWRDEYACLKVDNCLCINSICNWENNIEYIECIDNLVSTS